MPSTVLILPSDQRNSVPDRLVWLHEVKYDGYRMMVFRDDDRVRLVSRGGCDYASRFSWIVEAARKSASSPARVLNRA